MASCISCGSMLTRRMQSHRRTNSIPKQNAISSEANQFPLKAKQAPESAVLQTGPLGKVFVFVKDGFMYVYCMVGSTLVRVKVQLANGYVATWNRVSKTLDSLLAPIVACRNMLTERVMFVRATLLKTGVQISAKAFAVRDAAQTKALQIYAVAKERLTSIPVPVTIQKAFMLVLTPAGSFVVYVKNGFLQIYGTIGDVIVSMKTRILASGRAVQSKAYKTVVRVQKAIESYISKVKSSVVYVKCKVGDTVVIAKAKVLAKLTAIKKAIADAVEMVKTKVGDMFIYVQEGYLHIKTKIGDGVLCVKAKIVEAKGVVTLKIIDQYTTTKSMILDAASSAQVRVLSAVEQSKAIACGKPIAASAASGAVLGGASGGAAGLTTGGLAGAACGVPFALFTFGLSIPAGAVIGGSVGAAVGVAAGGAAGVVGGSAAGYTLKNRAAIKNGAMKQVTSLKDLGKGVQATLCGRNC